jgi:peptidyl-prolyl cis-trans isomerase D
MLSSMRTTAHSFVMKLLMLLLVVSFAAWGVGDILRGGGASYLVKVGGERVNYPEFARGLNNTERMMESMGFGNIPRGTLNAQVLRRLVEEKMIQQRLKESGLAVNDALLASRLKSASAFKGITGRFDPEIFKAALAQQQIPENVFLDDLRTDIRASLFTASLDTSDITPPVALAKLKAAADAERREAVLVTIPAYSVKFDAPSEADIEGYYEANKELLYMQPEKRTLHYVTFTQESLSQLAEANITPEMVSERVSEDPERFKTDGEQAARAELKSEQMETVADDVTMKVEDALAAGSTMQDAVKKAGISANERTLADINPAAAETTDPVVKAVTTRGFALDEGETSNLETTENGLYYMVTASEVIPASPKPLDNVLADVKKRASDRARSKALRQKADEVNAALAKSDDWQEALKPLGVNGRVVSNISRGKDSAIDATLAEAVFQHKVGEIAGPLLQKDQAQLAKVIAIRFAEPAAPQTVSDAEKQNLQQEVFASYYTALAKRYPVEVNEKMLNQIQAQEGSE